MCNNTDWSSQGQLALSEFVELQEKTSSEFAELQTEKNAQCAELQGKKEKEKEEEKKTDV